MNTLYPILIKLFFFLCLMQLALVMLGAAPVLHGALIDTDAYMHLNRVTELYAQGDWYQPLSLRSNAPFGETLHWTRSFDLILLLGTGLFLPFTKFGTALHLWGVLVSPVLQAIALVGLLWGIRSCFSQTQLLVIGGLFLMQPPIFLYSQAGRPDHHSLLLVLFMWFVACSWRLISEPFNRTISCAAGILGSLSIWTSVEGFIWLFIGLGVLTLHWVLNGGEYAKKGCYFSMGLFLATTVCLFIERPISTLTAIEYDRFSFVHWTTIALIWGFWLGLYGLARPAGLQRNPARRGLVTVLGIIVAVSAQIAWFPKFLDGPLVDQDPQMLTILWNNINETQPLVAWDPFRMGDLFVFLGLALPAVPYLAWLLVKEPSEEKKKLWFFVGGFLLILVPLAVMQARSSIFPAALLVIPYSDLLLRVVSKFENVPNIFTRSLFQMLCMLIGCLGLTALGVMLKLYEQPNLNRPSAFCPIPPLSKYLSDPAGLGQHSKTIMAYVNFGPELLYRTPHKVVSTPYHRNIGALLDTSAVMHAATTDEAYARLEKRQVDILVLCQESGEQGFYDNISGKAVFYEQLTGGTLPKWLHPLPLPDELSKHFKVFTVAPESHKLPS